MPQLTLTDDELDVLDDAIDAYMSVENTLEDDYVEEYIETRVKSLRQKVAEAMKVKEPNDDTT